MQGNREVIVHCAHTHIVDIDSVQGNPRNPNTHPDSQVKVLADIILGQGWRAPITISKRSNCVVRGHGRLAAAKLLGLATVPIDFQDYASDEAELADMIADNKIAEDSIIDKLSMANLLTHLKDVSFDMTLTGYTIDEMDEVISGSVTQTVVEDDYVPILPLEPNTKPGQIFALGNHRLMCGDSLGADVLALMDGKLADMIFTDPPYNVDVGEKFARLNNSKGLPKAGNTDRAIMNDKMSTEAFSDFMRKSYERMYEVVKQGGAVYICHSDTMRGIFEGELIAAGFLFKETLIWIKHCLVLSRSDYHWQHKPILYGWKPGASHSWHGGRKQTTVIRPSEGIYVSEVEGGGYQLAINNGVSNVIISVPSYEIIANNDSRDTTIWYVDKPIKSGEHPTMKPIKLCDKAIQNSSRPGQIVFDPFGGSGSTLIAAEQTGRTCYMCELDPKYCDVIIHRYEEFTGRKAELISG